MVPTICLVEWWNLYLVEEVFYVVDLPQCPVVQQPQLVQQQVDGSAGTRQHVAGQAGAAQQQEQFLNKPRKSHERL